MSTSLPVKLGSLGGITWPVSKGGQPCTTIERSASSAILSATEPGLLLPSHEQRDYHLVAPYELTTPYKPQALLHQGLDLFAQHYAHEGSVPAELLQQLTVEDLSKQQALAAAARHGNTAAALLVNLPQPRMTATSKRGRQQRLQRQSRAMTGANAAKTAVKKPAATAEEASAAGAAKTSTVSAGAATGAGRRAGTAAAAVTSGGHAGSALLVISPAGSIGQLLVLTVIKPESSPAHVTHNTNSSDNSLHTTASARRGPSAAAAAAVSGRSRAAGVQEPWQGMPAGSVMPPRPGGQHQQQEDPETEVSADKVAVLDVSSKVFQVSMVPWTRQQQRSAAAAMQQQRQRRAKQMWKQRKRQPRTARPVALMAIRCMCKVYIAAITYDMQKVAAGAAARSSARPWQLQLLGVAHFPSSLLTAEWHPRLQQVLVGSDDGTVWLVEAGAAAAAAVRSGQPSATGSGQAATDINSSITSPEGPDHPDQLLLQLPVVTVGQVSCWRGASAAAAASDEGSNFDEDLAAQQQQEAPAAPPAKLLLHFGCGPRQILAACGGTLMVYHIQQHCQCSSSSSSTAAASGSVSAEAPWTGKLLLQLPAGEAITALAVWGRHKLATPQQQQQQSGGGAAGSSSSSKINSKTATPLPGSCVHSSHLVAVSTTKNVLLLDLRKPGCDPLLRWQHRLYDEAPNMLLLLPTPPQASNSARACGAACFSRRRAPPAPENAKTAATAVDGGTRSSVQQPGQLNAAGSHPSRQAQATQINDTAAAATATVPEDHNHTQSRRHQDVAPAQQQLHTAQAAVKAAGAAARDAAASSSPEYPGDVSGTIVYATANNGKVYNLQFRLRMSEYLAAQAVALGHHTQQYISSKSSTLSKLISDRTAAVAATVSQPGTSAAAAAAASNPATRQRVQGGAALSFVTIAMNKLALVATAPPPPKRITPAATAAAAAAGAVGRRAVQQQQQQALLQRRRTAPAAAAAVHQPLGCWRLSSVLQVTTPGTARLLAGPIKRSVQGNLLEDLQQQRAAVVASEGHARSLSEVNTDFAADYDASKSVAAAEALAVMAASPDMQGLCVVALPWCWSGGAARALLIRCNADGDLLLQLCTTQHSKLATQAKAAALPGVAGAAAAAAAAQKPPSSRAGSSMAAMAAAASGAQRAAGVAREPGPLQPRLRLVRPTPAAPADGAGLAVQQQQHFSSLTARDEQFNALRVWVDAQMIPPVYTVPAIIKRHPTAKTFQRRAARDRRQITAVGHTAAMMQLLLPAHQQERQQSPEGAHVGLQLPVCGGKCEWPSLGSSSCSTTTTTIGRQQPTTILPEDAAAALARLLPPVAVFNYTNPEQGLGSEAAAAAAGGGAQGAIALPGSAAPPAAAAAAGPSQLVSAVGRVLADARHPVTLLELQHAVLRLQLQQQRTGATGSSSSRKRKAASRTREPALKRQQQQQQQQEMQIDSEGRESDESATTGSDISLDSEECDLGEGSNDAAAKSQGGRERGQPSGSRGRGRGRQSTVTGRKLTTKLLQHRQRREQAAAAAAAGGACNVGANRTPPHVRHQYEQQFLDNIGLQVAVEMLQQEMTQWDIQQQWVMRAADAEQGAAAAALDTGAGVSQSQLASCVVSGNQEPMHGAAISSAAATQPAGVVGGPGAHRSLQALLAAVQTLQQQQQQQQPSPDEQQNCQASLRSRKLACHLSLAQPDVVRPQPGIIRYSVAPVGPGLWDRQATANMTPVEQWGVGAAGSLARDMDKTQQQREHPTQPGSDLQRQQALGDPGLVMASERPASRQGPAAGGGVQQGILPAEYGLHGMVVELPHNHLLDVKVRLHPHNQIIAPGKPAAAGEGGTVAAAAAGAASSSGSRSGVRRGAGAVSGETSARGPPPDLQAHMTQQAQERWLLLADEWPDGQQQQQQEQQQGRQKKQQKLSQPSSAQAAAGGYSGMLHSLLQDEHQHEKQRTQTLGAITRDQLGQQQQQHLAGSLPLAQLTQGQGRVQSQPQSQQLLHGEQVMTDRQARTTGAPSRQQPRPDEAAPRQQQQQHAHSSQQAVGSQPGGLLALLSQQQRSASASGPQKHKKSSLLMPSKRK